MNTFIRFFYEFVSIFFDGFFMIVEGLVNGIMQIFDFGEYAKIIDNYKNSFSGPEKVFVFLGIAVLVIIILIIAALIFLFVRKMARRASIHMSKDELEYMIGVTFQQIQKYESGANRISASRLFVISKILQIDISFFFDGLERDIPAFVDFENDVNSVSEDGVKFDPMRDNETLQLVNAYWKLPDVEKRQKILDFIVSMT